jgi:methionyl-tRNA synthetase
MSKETILVCVAWPYANADIHQGNVTGSYLPADIYARYHRLKGNHVLMVSGSDSHGTPVTVKAEEEGKSIQEVFDYYHGRFLQLFQQFGLSYDLFTHTDTENHHLVAQEMFLRLKENGYLYPKITPQMYSPTANRFLPDRYIEGTCPNCGYKQARGDQCDNCNTLFEIASQLRCATPNISSSICRPWRNKAGRNGFKVTKSIGGPRLSTLLATLLSSRVLSAGLSPAIWIGE